MPAGNAKFLMDSVFELAQRINRFRLSDAEIGLFCSVVIITAGTATHFNLISVCYMSKHFDEIIKNQEKKHLKKYKYIF